MDAQEVLTKARDAMSVRRVVGDPIERDGVTLVPVALVAGGGGGGAGDDPQKGSGSGAGFGLVARPLGAYVIRGDDVRFVPAFGGDAILTAATVITLAWLRFRGRSSAG